MFLRSVVELTELGDLTKVNTCKEGQGPRKNILNLRKAEGVE